MTYSPKVLHPLSAFAHTLGVFSVPVSSKPGLRSACFDSHGDMQLPRYHTSTCAQLVAFCCIGPFSWRGVPMHLCAAALDPLQPTFASILNSTSFDLIDSHVFSAKCKALKALYKVSIYIL